MCDNADCCTILCLTVSCCTAAVGPPPTPVQPLRVDLTANCISPELEVESDTASSSAAMNFSCFPTQDAATHSSYCQHAVLTNLMSCPIAFTLQTTGPFKVEGFVASEPLSSAGLHGRPITASAYCLNAAMSKRSICIAASPELISLHPREHVDVAVRFLPHMQQQAHQQYQHVQPNQDSAHSGSDAKPRGISTVDAPQTSSAQTSQSPATESQVDCTYSGSIVVAYASGQQHQQRIKLQGAVIHPEVQASCSNLDFGEVHVQASKPLTVVLSNPTTADAWWSVQTVPSDAASSVSGASTSRSLSGAAKAATSASLAGPTSNAAVIGTGTSGILERSSAAFGAFTVSPASGVIPGRGLLMPNIQAVTVTCKPSACEQHELNLVFCVQNGRSCFVSLRGKGTTDEVLEYMGPLTQL